MEMTKPKNSFAVICHGDLWLSNILFKYNAISGTNGSSDDDQIEIRPIEVKFIDFQSARFASLATDLVLFLFTSVRVSLSYYPLWRPTLILLLIIIYDFLHILDRFEETNPW